MDINEVQLSVCVKTYLEIALYKYLSKSILDFLSQKNLQNIKTFNPFYQQVGGFFQVQFYLTMNWFESRLNFQASEILKINWTIIKYKYNQKQVYREIRVQI